MQPKQLIAQLLKIKQKSEHLALLKKHKPLLDLEFARALKDTYYRSWTKEPEKTRNAATALAALSKILPDDEIRALTEWVGGIADLTEGRLEKAIRDLDRAAEIFDKLRRPHDAAQTAVGKLIALALLGKYDEAFAVGKAALKIFESFSDELAAGKIEKNLGNIAARRGDERAAEKFYLAARRRFVRIGNIAEIAMSDNSLANTYAELNDFQKAEKFYAQALDSARAEKMHVTEAEIEASMGNLALFRGRYAEALRFLELSRRRYEELKMPHQTAIADLEIADIYLELNLAEEASAIYRRIAGDFRKLKMRGEEARARANFARALVVLGETATARAELKKAARLYEAEQNKIGAAAVKIAQANLELSENNYRKALKFAFDAETLLSAGANVRHRLAARWLKGEALRNLGKFSESEKYLTETQTEAVRQEQKNIAQISLSSLGKLFLQNGDFRRAENYFKRSVKIIESLRAPLAGEEFRMSFFADKLAPFENLARIYLAENNLKDAFAMLERARARTLAETLNNDPRGEKQFDRASKPAKKLALLREQLNWFYSRLDRADEAEIAELEKEIKRREKQIAETLRQIESVRTSAANENGRAPSSKNVFGPQTLQAALGDARALVEFVCFDGSFSAFIVTRDKIRFVENATSETEIAALLENLHFQFGALRYGAGQLGKFAGELKARADFYLRALYEKLFAPLEKFVENKHLVIVPSGVLHYVPFQALRGGGESENYLIETREIAYAPSAAVWAFLQNKPGRKIRKALLMGFADERIPFVNREIRELEEIFPGEKALTGARATVSAFTENAGKFDVLHLACHGQFRPENPLFSSLHLADGFVTVRDICAQKISAALVTLSACETGLNKIFAGDEILGLARGFLAAGADSLVLSLWTVNDEAAARLMKIFYANLRRGEKIPAALRAAQNELIGRGAHPYLWAPFAVIGK